MVPCLRPSRAEAPTVCTFLRFSRLSCRGAVESTLGRSGRTRGDAYVTAGSACCCSLLFGIGLPCGCFGLCFAARWRGVTGDTAISSRFCLFLCSRTGSWALARSESFLGSETGDGGRRWQAWEWTAADFLPFFLSRLFEPLTSLTGRGTLSTSWSDMVVCGTSTCARATPLSRLKARATLRSACETWTGAASTAPGS
jgi:hypothetical protein